MQGIEYYDQFQLLNGYFSGIDSCRGTYKVMSLGVGLPSWVFRTLYNRTHYRLFAFWDKSENLVIATHGIIKKTSKVPKKEIEKTELRTPLITQFQFSTWSFPQLQRHQNTHLAMAKLRFWFPVAGKNTCVEIPK